MRKEQGCQKEQKRVEFAKEITPERRREEEKREKAKKE